MGVSLQFERERPPGTHDVSEEPRAALAGRLKAQPVYPQLGKYLVRSGTYASCQTRTLAASRCSDILRIAIL